MRTLKSISNMALFVHRFSAKNMTFFDDLKKYVNLSTQQPNCVRILREG